MLRQFGLAEVIVLVLFIGMVSVIGGVIYLAVRRGVAAGSRDAQKPPPHGQEEP